MTIWKTLLLTIAIVVMLTTPLLAFEGGTYQDYSASAYQEASDFRRVLYFYASWCPTCQATDKKLTQTDIPKDVVVFRVDYDNSGELKTKYGIQYQDTFVQVDKDSAAVNVWHGQVDTLAKNLK